MALKVELEALKSINTSKLKNIRGRLALLIWEHTRLLGSNVTDALSTILQLLREELEEAS